MVTEKRGVYLRSRKTAKSRLDIIFLDVFPNHISFQAINDQNRFGFIGVKNGVRVPRRKDNCYDNGDKTL